MHYQEGGGWHINNYNIKSENKVPSPELHYYWAKNRYQAINSLGFDVALQMLTRSETGLAEKGRAKHVHYQTQEEVI